MQLEKSRIGKALREEDTYTICETLLRIEPTVDLYIREKWIAGHDTKLPVVLLHGAGMDSSGYDVPESNTSLVNALAQHGSRTFAFDFRGHGRSSRVADGKSVTVESSVADTVAVLDFVRYVTGQERAILIGESYGTMVAPVVAERYPERVAGLVLLGLIYATLATPIDDMLTELEQAPCGYAFTTEEEWEMFAPSAEPGVLKWHQAHFGTAYAYPVGPYFEAARLPHVQNPSRISSPILVVTGDQDPFASLEDTNRFLSAVASSDKAHLYQPGVGHMPYVEQKAEEARQAICELVNRCSGSDQ
ncbi:MAG: alpha/beta hydrolase [Thermogemmatispora sp.]|uniref:alpha/beta hydrolase n=1 Tax=Thermogemmatispora sp. TaxID=1968838 RepID=UPI0026026E16|nr:alpha/beta hydrolase [Thermogemmatispora sp.]MBX5457638.1 alpha/beta hydrolase [Thermogemmatispora sp.]